MITPGFRLHAPMLGEHVEIVHLRPAGMPWAATVRRSDGSLVTCATQALVPIAGQAPRPAVCWVNPAPLQARNGRPL